MDHDLQLYLKTASEIALRAGELVKTAFYKEKTVETKDSHADLVTETDKAVEHLVMTGLNQAFPSHKFIGEETVSEGKPCDWSDDPTWICDPIDGTSNFVHSIPFTCVCIGLSINKEMVVGVVFAPITNQMFTAVKGGGAFLNGERIRVSPETDLKKAIVYCEAGNSRVEGVLKTKMENMAKTVQAAQGIRGLGSAAYNMCMVAMGAGNAYLEYGIHVWDIAASAVIVTEAGGVVLDPTGSAVDFLSRRMVCAGTEALAVQLSKVVTHLELPRD